MTTIKQEFLIGVSYVRLRPPGRTRRRPKLAPMKAPPALVSVDPIAGVFKRAALASPTPAAKIDHRRKVRPVAGKLATIGEIIASK